MRAIVAILGLSLGWLATPVFADDAAPNSSVDSVYGALEQMPLTEDQVNTTSPRSGKCRSRWATRPPTPPSPTPRR